MTDVYELAAQLEAGFRAQAELLSLEATHFRLRAERAEKDLSDLRHAMKPDHIAGTHLVTGVEWGAMGIEVDCAMGNDPDEQGIHAVFVRGVEITDLARKASPDAWFKLETMAAIADDEQAGEYNAEMTACIRGWA